MQVDLAWPGNAGKEETFAAKERVFKAAYELDVIIHGGGESYQTTGIHTQAFTGLQVFFNHCAAGVGEYHPVTGQALQDESLTAKYTGAQTFGEGHFDFGAFGCT